jgi:hypothetical protein
MVTSSATVSTDRSARYAKQLIGHFQHKIEVRAVDDGNELVFAFGSCAVSARDATLVLLAMAPSAAELARVEDVVARHLLRFAVQDELRVEWTPAG